MDFPGPGWDYLCFKTRLAGPFLERLCGKNLRQRCAVGLTELVHPAYLHPVIRAVSGWIL